MRRSRIAVPRVVAKVSTSVLDDAIGNHAGAAMQRVALVDHSIHLSVAGPPRA